MRRAIPLLLLLALATALGLGIFGRLGEIGAAKSGPQRTRGPVPVEIALAERGPITLRRTFSGALEAAAEFVAAPKVAGRLRTLHVDMGDVVRRGQVIATLEDDELEQEVRQAEAELQVADAGLAEARSALEIAERSLRRTESLGAEGVASESELDTARSQALARRARVQVTEANLLRARSSLETARIRQGYCQVTADWSSGDDERVVAERFVDEGETVGANAPLLTIVEVDPIVAVVFVPERDYSRLVLGQEIRLTTDAHAGRSFEGAITRIAPVFRRSTRQARVELQVSNPDEALKPGMFVRAIIDLETVQDATVVPYDAITSRAGMQGVYVLDDARRTVRWREVRLGVQEKDFVQILGEPLEGWVVTLGQELCEDGAAVLPSESDRFLRDPVTAASTPVPDQDSR